MLRAFTACCRSFSKICCNSRCCCWCCCSGRCCFFKCTLCLTVALAERRSPNAFPLLSCCCLSCRCSSCCCCCCSSSCCFSWCGFSCSCCRCCCCCFCSTLPSSTRAEYASPAASHSCFLWWSSSRRSPHPTQLHLAELEYGYDTLAQQEGRWSSRLDTGTSCAVPPFADVSRAAAAAAAAADAMLAASASCAVPPFAAVSRAAAAAADAMLAASASEIAAAAVPISLVLVALTFASAPAATPPRLVWIRSLSCHPCCRALRRTKQKRATKLSVSVVQLKAGRACRARKMQFVRSKGDPSLRSQSPSSVTKKAWNGKRREPSLWCMMT